MKHALSLIILSFSLGLAQHDSTNHAQHETQTHQDSSFSEREAEVMPFSLEATLHLFEDTATGGIQRVITNDELDKENIRLIREHLKEEAKLFAQGLFTDPSYLHGNEMPGLASLKEAGANGRLNVEYKDIELGGQISYNSTDLNVVIALHLWFQAQVLDHGDHAAVSN